MARRGHFLPILPFLVVLTICLTCLVGPVRPVHAASLPDLTVDSIRLEEASSPGQPVTQVAPGDQFLIVASIKNLGSATASGYYVDVYYDNDYGRGGPDIIAPGETQVWYVGNLTAVAGTHTTKWIVDPDNQIAESNETNNEKDYTFTVSTLTVTPKVVTSSGASIDTSQSKFGGASGKFVASSSQYLSTPDSAGWYFASNDFTIDFWVRFNSLPGAQAMTVFSQYSDGNNGQRITLGNDSTYGTIAAWYIDSGGTTLLNWFFYPSFHPLLINTWYHIAAVRYGNTWNVYFNGIAGTVYYKGAGDGTCSVPDIAGPLYIGQKGDGSKFLDGWLDEFRVSKGIARWTSNFTPPTGPYSRDSQTVLLLHMDGNNGSTTFEDDVTVQDKTHPVVTVPADMTVNATGSDGAIVTFSASASDIVDGSVPVTCTPPSGSTFPIGTSTVTCSASDKAGNSASGSFKVTVSAVTVTLLNSSGYGLSGAVVQYYGGGWKSFGTTGSDGTVSMALPPGTYLFQITYAGASIQKTQNIATNPNVVFQTVKVHSDSGKCVKYIQVATAPTRYPGPGWQTFTQDMELLPGTYMFQFSDGTTNTTYTLVVGAVKHLR